MRPILLQSKQSIVMKSNYQELKKEHSFNNTNSTSCCLGIRVLSLSEHIAYCIPPLGYYHIATLPNMDDAAHSLSPQKENVERPDI